MASNYTVPANPQKVECFALELAAQRRIAVAGCSGGISFLLGQMGLECSRLPQPSVYGPGHQKNDADDGIELEKRQLHSIE